MGQDTFRDNEKVVPPTLEKRDAHFQGVIPIEKQVVIALWRLATGKSFCSTVAKAFCFVSLANFFCTFFSLTALYLNLIQDGPFWGCSRKGPLSEICHTYPRMMRIGAIILYLKKIQKLYKLRDTLLEFC